MRTLILFLLTSAAIAVHASDLDESATQGLLARIAAQRTGKAMQSDFREEKSLPLMNKPVIQSGTVAYLPPDKFLREVRGETPSRTLSDGVTLWIYYPRFQEAEKYTLASQKSLREGFDAMAATFHLENLPKLYHVKAQRNASGYTLQLLPLKPSLRKLLTSATITLDDALHILSTDVISPAGDRTLTTYTNEKPSTFSAKDFQFVPPPGTNVSEPLGK